MESEQQLLVRIKATLNSEDLTNTPALHSLFLDYVAWNNAVAARLNECSVLLQKKLKIEAVTLAQQAPDVFEQLEMLMGEHRTFLLNLGNLYDWETPDIITPDVVENLRKALASADDLLPLLAEYRRIARTDLIKEKLQLLREISVRDKDNREWDIPLREMENKYLSQLIAEAKLSIENKNYERLKQIHGELVNSNWVVPIPKVVLEKVAKIMDGYNCEQRKKRAVVLLDEVNSAYGEYNVEKLETALAAFRNFCRETDYTPGESENIQLNEAKSYLAEEKERLQRIETAKHLIDEITTQLDNNEVLEKIEKNYAALQATGENIPDYIANRMIQYRSDTERDIRIKAVLKGCKIVGLAAVIILILTAGGFWTAQYIIEKKQYDLLMAEVKKGNIETAQSVLADIEKKYPRLARRHKISQACAELNRLIETDKKRAGDVERMFAEIDSLWESKVPELTIKDKLNAIGELVRSDSEKARHRELVTAFEEKWESYQDKINGEARDIFEKAQTTFDEVNSCIKNGDYVGAENNLKEIVNLRERFEKLQHLNQEMLAEGKETFSSYDNWIQLLERRKAKRQTVAGYYQRLSEAGNFESLSQIVNQAKGELNDDSLAHDKEIFEQLHKDAVALNEIFVYQKNPILVKDADQKNTLFFKDVIRYAEIDKNFENVKNALVAYFGNITRINDDNRLCFIRFKTMNDGYIDIYAFNGDFSQSDDIITIRRTDEKKIHISRAEPYSSRFTVKIDDDEYFGCKLITPQNFSVEDFKKSRAAHQLLAAKVCKRFIQAKPQDIYAVAFEAIRMIARDKNCAALWKMNFTLNILQHVANGKYINDPVISKLKEELEKISLQKPENPLYNKVLAEEIDTVFNNFDWSYLDDLSQKISQNQKLQKKITARRFKYLTAVIKGKTISTTELKNGSGEVWCLDESGIGCYLLGNYDKDEIFWEDDNAKQMAESRVLFTVTGASAAEIQPGLNRENIAIHPDFWPRNLKGDEK